MKYDHTGPMPIESGITDDLGLRKAGLNDHPCAACGTPCVGAYSIYRDGFEDGPEVALCPGCGEHSTPTCEELWQRIAERMLGTQVRFENAPRMRLLRWTAAIPEALARLAGFEGTTWSRYIVRVPDRNPEPIDRVAVAWHGPSHKWTRLTPTLKWDPFVRGLTFGDAAEVVTVVSLQLRGDETVDELRALALAAGGPIE